MLPWVETVKRVRKEGMDAYRSGMANAPKPHPYRAGSELWGAWWDGWQTARLQETRAQEADDS